MIFVNFTVEAETASGLEAPEVLAVSVGLLVVLVLAAVATTEPGKYWLGLLGAPLFTRTVDVLDNKTRNTLLGMIMTSPGIHFSALREESDLPNGMAAHHLRVLEREGFIKSVRDGKRKRFYSAHTKVPEDLHRSPKETRGDIIDLVRRQPGINQLEVMEELGLDRDGASYYLRDLVRERQLKAGRDGWYTVYWFRGRG